MNKANKTAPTPTDLPILLALPSYKVAMVALAVLLATDVKMLGTLALEVTETTPEVSEAALEVTGTALR